MYHSKVFNSAKKAFFLQIFNHFYTKKTSTLLLFKLKINKIVSMASGARLSRPMRLLGSGSIKRTLNIFKRCGRILTVKMLKVQKLFHLR